MKARSYTMHRLATDEAAVRDVLEAARAAPNGEIREVERKLAEYEIKYKRSSASVAAAVANGEMRPTRDVEGWMMAIRVRDHLAKARAR